MEERDVMVIDKKIIETAAKSLPRRGDVYDEAMAIRIRSKPTYERGVWLKNTIKKLIDSIHESLDPICSGANKLHKLSTKTRGNLLELPEKALNHVLGELDYYDREGEKKRQEAEAKKRAEAERKAQEERDRQVEELQEAGAEEEAEVLSQAPVIAAPVEVKSRIADVKGVQYRDNWKAVVVDESKIPREYMIPDLVKLNKVAKALKKDFNIPGCKAKNERVVI